VFPHNFSFRKISAITPRPFGWEIAESLEVIQQTASLILSALEPPVEAEDSEAATETAEVAA